MAVVRVSFDDAVIGRMPNVCAKTGGPADRLMTAPARIEDHHARRRMAGLQPPPFALAVLLGWAVTSYSTDTIGVQVPWSAAAQRHVDRAVRGWRIAWWIALVATAAAIVTLPLVSAPGGGEPALPLLVVVVLMTGAWLSGRAVRRARVRATVDAERRWVTLRGVHRDFADAVEARRAEHG